MKANKPSNSTWPTLTFWFLDNLSNAPGERQRGCQRCLAAHAELAFAIAAKRNCCPPHPPCRHQRTAAQAARFEVQIEKARTLVGEGALPFEAAVEPFDSENGNAAVRWVARDLKPPLINQAAELFATGLSVREVAAQLGISRSEAGRLRLAAVLEGLFPGEQEDGNAEEEFAPEAPGRLN